MPPPGFFVRGHRQLVGEQTQAAVRLFDGQPHVPETVERANFIIKQWRLVKMLV